MYEKRQHNDLGSELCKAIGLDPKGVQSISVTINCAVDDVARLSVVATLDVSASGIADERMLAFFQNESNLKTLKTIYRKVEIKTKQDHD